MSRVLCAGHVNWDVTLQVDGLPEPDGEAADAWRMWQHEYEATERHEVVVRAIDGNGERQPEAESDLRPSGPTGWVSETIEL